ncbi:OmpA family protein [Fulvivirga maritima]|uniref:OmpA family protein n=1 Tax=Fulvivirga maritima TaxID=2904247 RepID=UPI001F261E4C|nr:OmpA family protein [Fulvivirga maritima]UII26295.1 OmpA family protein [Fulvivirga maritima]
MIKNFCVLFLMLVISTSGMGQSQDKNILAAVNSQYDEINPVLSPDGQKLYFTRRNHPANVGGIRDEGDIWVSTLTDDHQWSEPQNVKELNSRNWNGVIGFEDGGETIVLHNHYKEENGIVRTQGISTAKKTRKGWSAPQDVNIPYFKNLSDNPGGYLSKDEQVLVMSLESYGTRGAEDIYVCLRKPDGSWGDPKNLGSTINTEFQEFTPYISDDNKTLYFASNGHGGKGSSDIFVSERLDNTWQNWSEPKGLQVLNTKGRETGYRIYDDFALYASTINSDGYSDIRFYTEKPIDSIMMAEPEAPEEPVVQIKEVTDVPESRANQVTMYGKVLNKDSRQSINAIVTVSGTETEFKKEVTTAAENGYYSLSIPASGKYEVRVDAPGYISQRENLEVNTGEMKLVEINYNLQPISVGTKVHLKNVLFEQSKPTILESSYQELDLVVDLMKQNPDMKIRLEGHTDNRGIPKYNVKLSKARVEAVKDYLVDHGIASKRISGKGYGGSKPIADNDDPMTRKLNRRVEFTIMKN